MVCLQTSTTELKITLEHSAQFTLLSCELILTIKLLMQNIQCGMTSITRSADLLEPHVLGVLMIQFKSKEVDNYRSFIHE